MSDGDRHSGALEVAMYVDTELLVRDIAATSSAEIATTLTIAAR